MPPTLTVFLLSHGILPAGGTAVLFIRIQRFPVKSGPGAKRLFEPDPFRNPIPPPPLMKHQSPVLLVRPALRPPAPPSRVT